MIRRYSPNSVLVIIDAKPKDLGLPTEAYQAVEEVHDVRTSLFIQQKIDMKENKLARNYILTIWIVFFRTVHQLQRLLNIYQVKLAQKKRRKLALNICSGISKTQQLELSANELQINYSVLKVYTHKFEKLEITFFRQVFCCPFQKIL